MEVVLYQNNSEMIVVTKNVTRVKTLNCQLLDESSIITPSLIIDRVITANYCYIPEFKRYYFITDITILDGRRCKIDCRVDVLTTYNTEIRSSKQHVIRQRNAYNLYLSDRNMELLSKYQIQTLNFKPPTGGWIINNDITPTGYNYILNSI